MTRTTTLILGLGATAYLLAGCGVGPGEAGSDEAEAAGQAVGALTAGQTNFVRNDYLLPGQSLPSTGCGFTLNMQSDGNLVLYKLNSGGPASLWASNTAGIGNNAFMTMQPDGNLVVYDSTGGSRFVTATHRNPGAFAAVQWDGNFVVYRSDNAALWVSGTNGPKFTKSTCSTPRSFVHVDQGTVRNGEFLDVTQVTGSTPVLVGKACAAVCNGRSSCRSFGVVTVHTGPAIDFYGRCTLYGDATAPRQPSAGNASGIVCRFTSTGALAPSHSADCTNDAVRMQ